MYSSERFLLIHFLRHLLGYFTVGLLLQFGKQQSPHDEGQGHCDE
jgi:hypothetical protein